MNASSDNEMLRQRRLKRNVLLLALLAIGFYAGFILLSMSRAHG
jgi:hypothetical protein